MAKKKMGRPPTAIDMEQLSVFCRLRPTVADCAAFFKCSVDAVQRRIKAETGLTFSEYLDQCMVHTRFNLVRKALSKAQDGDNCMLIFCLKNFCGWRDKQPNEDGPTVVIQNAYEKMSDAELERRRQELLAKKT